MTEKQIQELKELRKYFKPHQKAFIMSAITFLDTSEIAKIIGKSKLKIERYIKIFTEEHIKLRMKQMFSEAKLQRWMEGELPGFKVNKRLRRGSKRNIIGVREDLKQFFRSKMEANFARVLNMKYGRSSWTYECEIFELSPTKNKKIKYLPDFHIKTKKEDFYVEVKGRFFTGDITKLRKFIKEYPDKKLVMMTCRSSKKVKAFAEKYKLELWLYEDLRDDYSYRIPEWE